KDEKNIILEEYPEPSIRFLEATMLNCFNRKLRDYAVCNRTLLSKDTLCMHYMMDMMLMSLVLLNDSDDENDNRSIGDISNESNRSGELVSTDILNGSDGIEILNRRGCISSEIHYTILFLNTTDFQSRPYDCTQKRCKNFDTDAALDQIIAHYYIPDLRNLEYDASKPHPTIK
ncbi:3364_t:CDS:2, partial [Dentiscutata heterogama]